jgi:heme a synthase
MSWQLVIDLILIALFIGSIPLIFSAYKGKLKNLNQFIGLLIFLTFDLILFGAFTRLTDSGLGCPDWPGCYGHSNPLLAMSHILEAQQAMPFGPVTVSKAWIEMIHRYFASGLGFLIIVLNILAWKNRAIYGIRIWQASFGLFLLVCLQGAFGAFTVTMKLQPIIVAIHLMLALTLIVGLTILLHITGNNADAMKPKNYRAIIPIFVILIVYSQIFLGAWVSTNYAVLACHGFPTCNGSWLPNMDFLNGFTLWRELGKTANGEYLNIEALIAIHWSHRVGALVIFMSVSLFLLYLRKIYQQGNAKWQQQAHYWSTFVLIVLLIQVLSGLSNVIFQWPLVAAIIHTGGASALVIGVTKLLLLAYQRPYSK